MQSKLIFLDLDGTIIDHKNNEIPESTKETIRKLQENNHKVVIATGRPPCLFYGIDKTLNIDSYIASNGRLVQADEAIIFHDYIEGKAVDTFVKDAEARGLEVGFETKSEYILHKKITGMAEKFNKHFNLEPPKERYNFHKENDILQMILYTKDHNIDELKEKYSDLFFNISCPYGIDINTQGGMKEVGVKLLMNHFKYDVKDTISIGDGYNDIGLIQHTHIGIAMGNACQPLKDVADYVTDDCDQDGIKNIMEKLKLI